MWGPPPTPPGVPLATGAWSAVSRPAAPPSERGCPTCPAWLDADTKRAWCEVSMQLDARGKQVNRDALIRYVIMWRNWRKLLLFVEQHGMTEEIDQVRRIRPEAKQVGDIDNRLSRLEQGFGLTPDARPRPQA